LSLPLRFLSLACQVNSKRLLPRRKGAWASRRNFLELGETASLHGDEHFPMHSVYKLPIWKAVLQRVDRES
jgi:beta-lactamase class A